MPATSRAHYPHRHGQRPGVLTLGRVMLIVFLCLLAIAAFLGLDYLYHYSDGDFVITRHVQTLPTKKYQPKAQSCTGADTTGVTGGTIIAMNRHSAGTSAAHEYLKELRCSQVDEVVYASKYVSSGTMKQWIGDAEDAGQMTGLQLNAIFTTLGSDADRVDYIRHIYTDSNLIDYWISVNDAPRNKAKDGDVPGSAAVEHWQDLLAQGAGREARLLGDYVPTPGEEPTNEQDVSELAGAPYVPVYLPVGAPKGYGPVDAYPDVGKQAYEVSGVDAIVGIQAMGQDDVERPSPADIGGFATAVNSSQHPVTKILLYSEEPDADDTAYIVAAAAEVRAVIG